MFDINHGYGTASQNSSGAVTTPGFGPMCAATSSSHVYSASCNWQSLFHRRATCLECTAVWHETDLVWHQLPQEAQDTLFSPI